MPLPSLEELTARVLEILRDDILVTDADFSVETDLIGAGLDSLSVTQLLLSIEEYTGVWVDEALLTPENVASVRTLSAMVHGQLPGT
jgi:acyl carrier protein